MAKLKLKIGAEAANVEAVEGFKPYTGKTPPKGVYPCVVRQIAVTESNKSKKDMFRVIVEIKAPKGDKREQFNGYSMFDYLVVPDSVEEEHYGLLVGKINALLDAMSGGKQSVRDALWGGDAVISNDSTPKIEKLGPLNCKKEVPVVVVTKDEMRTFMEEDEDGNPVEKTERQLRVNSYHAVEDEDADGADEDVEEDIVEEEEPEEKPQPRRRRKAAPKPKPEPEPEPEDDEDDEDEPEADDSAEDDADPEEDFADEHVDAAEVPDEDDEEDEEEAEEEEAEEEEAPKPRRRRRASF